MVTDARRFHTLTAPAETPRAMTVTDIWYSLLIYLVSLLILLILTKVIK